MPRRGNRVLGSVCSSCSNPHAQPAGIVLKEALRHSASTIPTPGGAAGPGKGRRGGWTCVSPAPPPLSSSSGLSQVERRKGRFAWPSGTGGCVFVLWFSGGGKGITGRERLDQRWFLNTPTSQPGQRSLITGIQRVRSFSIQSSSFSLHGEWARHLRRSLPS